METTNITVPFTDISFEVTKEDIVSEGLGISAGLLAGFTTERIIDALLPEVSGLKAIATMIGKWCIADLVGVKVANETENTVRECFDTINEMNEKIDEAIRMALELEE